MIDYGYIRVTYSLYNEERWLVYSDDKFHVYSKKKNKKNTKLLIETKSEEDAVYELLTNIKY